MFAKRIGKIYNDLIFVMKRIRKDERKTKQKCIMTTLHLKKSNSISLLHLQLLDINKQQKLDKKLVIHLHIATLKSCDTKKLSVCG